MYLPELLHLAGAQHGCFTRRQAFSFMTRRQLEHAKCCGLIEQVFPETFVMHGAPKTWKRFAMAAVLSVPGSVLAGHAAAKLWGLKYAEEERIEIVSESLHQHRRRGVIVHRSEQLRGFTGIVDNIPCTNVARTIVDVSNAYSWRQIGAIIDQARILNLSSATKVNACLDAMITKGRPEISKLRQALEPRLMDDKDLDSFLERQIHGWLRSNGFPAFESQVPMKGRKWYRLDIWYPEHQINIEPNGPHHLLPSFAADDHRRDADLQSRGAVVLRVPLEMTEAEFVESVSALMRFRQSNPGA